jgi:hypothetical protein
MPNAHFHVLRRQFLKALAAAIFTLFLPRLTHAAAFLRQEPLGFLDRLPKDSANYFADDVRLLVGWVTDAAAVRQPLRPGDRVDRTRSFRSVPGFAAPTDISALSARYRIVAAPIDAHGYYGVILGLLDASDATVAVLLINRLFRMPVILQEPVGLATDLVTIAGLLFGFRNSALDTALDAARAAFAEALSLDVPLIVAGQSQAGATAQLQIAALAVAPGWRAGQGGFITFNAAPVRTSIVKLGLDPTTIPGINFIKDLDPLVGPHGMFTNGVGQQIFIHADGTGGLEPRASVLAALSHPRQHFLDSFGGVSLATALAASRGK